MLSYWCVITVVIADDFLTRIRHCGQTYCTFHDAKLLFVSWATSGGETTEREVTVFELVCWRDNPCRKLLFKGWSRMESLSLHPSLFLSHILSPSLFPSPFLSHTHILALSFSLRDMHSKTDIHAWSHTHIHTPQHTETRTRTYTQARRHTRTRACTHKTVDLCVFSFLKCMSLSLGPE